MDGFVELYSTLFPDDETNYNAEEIVELTKVAKPDRHVDSENILLIALHRGTVVGFIRCHFYPDRRKAIVSYFGINKQVLEARRSAAKKLLLKLKKILSENRRVCDFLFFDLQKPEDTISKAENSERRARPVLFKNRANSLGLKAYKFNFAYRCPKISLDHDAHEHPLVLMCVPLASSLERIVPKATILEFLQFIYLDCYGDLYPVTNERFLRHREHLTQLLAEYETSLPDEILTDS